MHLRVRTLNTHKSDRNTLTRAKDTKANQHAHKQDGAIYLNELRPQVDGTQPVS